MPPEVRGNHPTGAENWSTQPKSPEKNQGLRAFMELRTAANQSGTWETIADKMVQILDRSLHLMDDPKQVEQAKRMLTDTRINTPAVQQALQRIENQLHNLGVRPTEAAPLPSAEVVPLPSAEAVEAGAETFDDNPPETATVEVVSPADQYEQGRAEVMRDTMSELVADIKKGRTGSAIDLSNKIGRWRQEIASFGNEILRTRLEMEITEAETVANGIPDARRRAA